MKYQKESLDKLKSQIDERVRYLWEYIITAAKAEEAIGLIEKIDSDFEKVQYKRRLSISLIENSISINTAFKTRATSRKNYRFANEQNLS